MFPVKTLKQAIGHDVAISSEMVNKIELWAMMNKGIAPWTDETIHSMRLEKGICREFANICLNEMETSVSNKRLNDIYQMAIRDLNENLQNGLALGSFIIKPLGENRVEYVTADRFIPIEFDATGRLLKVVFVQTKRLGENNYYIRFEYHSLDKKGLTIENKAYHTNNLSSIGKQVPLTDIDEWASLPPSIFYPGVAKPDFGYYRNPISNDIDGSGCGVSIFDTAIELIRKADTQFSRLDWEFESGERAIHVDELALQYNKNTNRSEVARLNKRLYRGLNLDGGNTGELFKEYSPELRDASIINGLNAYLRRIEFNTSLAYGDLSDAQDTEKTATELKIAKKRKYNMVTAIQANLKECLEDLVYALAFYNAMLTSGYEFVCNFKDSILTDEEAERNHDRQDVAMGVMSLEEYRSRWYGETLEEAKSKLPENADIIL